jgi:hypothetical protein
MKLVRLPADVRLIAARLFSVPLKVAEVLSRMLNVEPATSVMPLNVELRGYRHASQRLTIAAVAGEVVGPEEAKRLLGPEVASALSLSCPLVRVEAVFPRDTFQASGGSYALHDGMWGSAEVSVRSESLLAALVPGLRAVLERLRG